MSEVNWDLIERLSRRFDAMIGIATEEHLQKLYDNFHLVSVVLDGRFEEYMKEFVPVQPPPGDAATDCGQVRERLRQYSVRALDGIVLESLLTPELRCSPELLESGLWTMTAGTESGRIMRLKLLRFDGPSSFHDVEKFLRSKELVPADLSQLVAFAAEHTDDLPELLTATGTLAVGTDRVGETPSGTISLPVVRRLADGSGFEIGLESQPGLSARSFAAGRIFLAARYPRERK